MLDHLSLTVTDLVRSCALYAAALAAGGRDHGLRGPRLQYHPGYYGAFVLDPDGLNIQAVCHTRV
jgi:catechol 2,3-dioxygenase-like lactoylglutathione lyase family enzyme